jgi:molecular chaperone GrpE
MKDEEQVDDVQFIDSDEEGLEKGASNKVKDLREKITALEKEKQEYLDGWQRARADYANLLKSSEEDKKRLKFIIQEDILEKLLPVVDSFDQAFNNKEAWEKVEPNWRKGVEYIHQQLMNILKDHSLHAFGELGEKFDPAFHLAVSETETKEESADHTVAEVLQKGYKIGDSIIRPARVSVYVFKL